MNAHALALTVVEISVRGAHTARQGLVDVTDYVDQVACAQFTRRNSQRARR